MSFFGAVVSDCTACGRSGVRGAKAGSSGSGSSLSFWYSKTETFCGLPSSRTVKSSFLRPGISCPERSRTNTSTTTRLLVARKVMSSWAAMGMREEMRLKMSERRMLEAEPHRTGHRSHRGCRRGETVVSRVHHRTDARVAHGIAEVPRIDAKLQAAAFAQGEVTGQRKVRREQRWAWNRVSARVAEQPRRRRRERGGIEEGAAIDRDRKST